MARNKIHFRRIPLRFLGLISRRCGAKVEQASCLFSFGAISAWRLALTTAIFRGGYLRCDLSTPSAARASSVAKASYYAETSSDRMADKECLRCLRSAVIFVSLIAPALTAYSGTGDILRGGYVSPTATGTAGNGSGSTATVAKLRALEADQLARTTQAIQAVRAMQAAAQSIAANGPNNLGMNPNNPGHQLPNVPNGLGIGGLQVAPGATPNSSLWQNANLPTQSTVNGQTTVTIQQSAPKAILSWQTFNVGKNTTAYFNQSAGTQTNGTNNWIALNRVTDPSGVPSQILGSIKAEGQVYIINQNGIIFGGSSQVNVNTLYASTLNIPDASFNEGFLAYEANTYSSAATFSTTMGNAGPTAGTTNPAFSRFYLSSDNQSLNNGFPSLSATKAPVAGPIIVQPGASITTPTGGRVVLLGAHVTNGGTISTPNGQTILAAGDSAYIYAQPTTQMEGLSVDVLIDRNTNNTKVNPMADPTVGTVVNSGIITVGEGNATMDGAILTQNGVISAMTGVNTPGSIILTARYAPDTGEALGDGYIAPTIPGSVTFGPYSITEVLPDLSDPTTTLDAQGFTPSVVVAQGQSVVFEGSSFASTPVYDPNGQALSPGALVMAPGGTVSVTAPVTYGVVTTGDSYANAYNILSKLDFVPIYQSTTPGATAGTILLDKGAAIDVSGTQDVAIPVSRNVVGVNLRANELADSPLQRNGPLYGQTVYVDITETGKNPDGSTWYGTPFANASGYIATIGRTVAERTAVGGEVNLLSGGSVVAVNGSTLNVSGGWIDYQGGLVATTRLLGTNGHLYDISNADPSISYVGIAGTITITHPRWGVTQTFNTPIIGPTDQSFEQNYLDGRSAGAIDITSGQTVLDGTLLGQSVSGPRQQTVNANVDSSVPLGGSLTLQAPPNISVPSPIDFVSPIDEGLTFVTAHANLDSTQILALATGTISLSDPSIDRGKTLLLPVDLFSAGGFTTFSTEAASSGTSSTNTVTAVSPFTGNVLLPAGVSLDFGTQASALLNFNPDGTVARNPDGTLSTVSTNSGNSANLTVDTYGNVDLEGSIKAPAGKIAFSAGVLSGIQLLYDPSYLAHPPSITVGSAAGSNPTFDLRGLWTNETNLTSDDQLQPIWINGGSFSLSAPGGITVSPGTTIDVTGGGHLPATGKLTAAGEGTGGSIVLKADANPYLSAGFGGQPPNLQPVQFEGTMLAYGLGGNGTLTLGAGAIMLTGSPSNVIQSAMIQTSSGQVPGILVPSGFVSNGQFSSYTFNSASDLKVAAGAFIYPNQETLSPISIQQLRASPSGSDIYSFARPFLLPRFERPPASITLTAMDLIDVPQGATIETDPKGAITLKSTPFGSPLQPGIGIAAAYINVDGLLYAPAGNITLDNGFPVDQQSISSGANNSIYLGSNSVLSAAGTSLLTTDQFGNVIGSVLPGGNITLQNTLYAVAAPGSLIDVSGATAMEGLATGRLIGLKQQYVPSLVASNGGSISISALSGLYLQGRLLGTAGDYSNPKGAVSVGGSLAIQILGKPVISQTDNFPYVSYDNGGLIVSNANLLHIGSSGGADFSPDPIAGPGNGFVTVQTLTGGGFDTVSLQAGNFIQFVGNLSLQGIDNLALHSPVFSATSKYNASGNYSANDNPTVTVSANHLFIDGEGGTPGSELLGDLPNIIANRAILNFQANTLDITGFQSGDTSTPLPSVGRVNFTAIGDIRFVPIPVGGNNSITSSESLVGSVDNNNVVLKVPVSFQATQIYPLSGVFETVADTYPPSNPADPASVTFARSSGTSTGSTPLSAGATLSVFAPDILQGGVIKVPLGTLTLGFLKSDTINGQPEQALVTQSLTLAPGSLTSVSLDGNVVPWGLTRQSGTLWDLYSGDATFSRLPPPATIDLNGANIKIQSDPHSGASAVIDGSGGGDLYAYEFTPGVGGSHDVLNHPTSTSASGVYAILPGYDQYSLLGSPANVYNTVIPSSDPAPQYGQMVYLTGVAGLPAGNYTLLPAHYALLPGAYSVTLASSSISAIAKNVVNPVGSYAVLGYLDTAANRGVRTDGTHNPWQQFLVESGSVVRSESQYIESRANSFTYDVVNPTTGIPVQQFPLLPQDAGQVVISPTQSLLLDGQGVFNHANGTIGGRADLNISANVAIVGSGGNNGTTGASGTDYGSSAIVISASGINNLHAESILIGGTRKIAPEPTTENGSIGGPNATYIVAKTSNITVDNDASTPLQAPEVILVSNDQISMKSASVVRASGAVNGPSNGDLEFVPDFSHDSTALSQVIGAPGAVIRVSDGPNISFNRFGVAMAPTNGNTGYGNLLIQPGAQLSSGNAILLEGYQTATLSSGALLTAPSITAAGSLVSLGNVPGTNGLTFSGQTFAGLNATQNLTLISSTRIDIWGTAGEIVNIGNANLVNLVLDAGQISNRVNASSVVLTAGNVTLQASSAYNSPEGSSNGSLTVNALTLPNGAGGQLTIGPGAKFLDGFSAVTLTASKEILSDGQLANPQPGATPQPGSLTVPGSLTLVTPLLTAASDSDQQITAAGAFVLAGPAGVNSSATLQSLNAGFSVSATSIALASSIVMPSGVFSAEATTGDLVVNPGAVINVRGVAQQFFDQVRYAAGGEVQLVSDKGNVTLSAGSVINVSGFAGSAGIAGGGDAGILQISAGESAANPATGTITSQGQLLGTAATGNKSGSFVLNAGTLPDYSGLNTELNAGGFAESRNLRIRTGNVVISGTAIAHTFILSADGADGVGANSGNITVLGEINASGTRGGTIELAAGGDVKLEPGSLLDAHATTTAVDGYGKPIDAENEATVEISSENGTLNLAGGTINVSIPGADAVTGQGFGGDVHLRVSAANAGSTTAGPIIGASSVALESFQTFSLAPGSTIDSVAMSTIQNLFNSISVATPAGLANVGNLHVRAGVEIDSTGDITVDDGTTGWDFSSWRSANGEPGYLTIRAVGNLNINSTLSDGFNGVPIFNSASQTVQNGTSTLLSGNSWTYTLVSGADLRAADPTQVESVSELAGSGNFALAADNYIRTGTGNITIAVGGDLTLGNALSTIYTVGQAAANTAQGVTPGYSIVNPINFPTDGGNIALDVQGKITAVQTPQLITDWLWRQGGVDQSSPTAPGTYIPEAWGPIFGVAALIWQSQGFLPGRFNATQGYYSFAQGIGALGGGNISVTAGGSITDLSVVIPSNGYQVSPAGSPSGPGSLAIQGGGDLVVRAGGNIGPALTDTDLSGNPGGPGAIFYVARGIGSISTTRLTPEEGSVTAEIPIDDAVVSVVSGGALKLAPFDPMVENQVFGNLNGANRSSTLRRISLSTVFRSYAFGYTNRTELDETSNAGNILPAFEPFNAGETATSGQDPNYQFLHNGWGYQNGSYPLEFVLFSLTGNVGSTLLTQNGVLTGSVQVLPPTMRVTAFLGKINTDDSTDIAYAYLNADFQFPSATGTADYLAYSDITSLPALSDADPANYPSLINPEAFVQTTSQDLTGSAFLVSTISTFPEAYGVPVNQVLPSVTQVHWQGLLHAGDSAPVHIYSIAGNIAYNGHSTGENSAAFQPFEIPKPVWMKAGGDVTILLNQVQLINNQVQTYTTQWIENLAPSDVSVIEAGGNLNLNLRVAGPGTLYLQAGKNFLGNSQVISEGNGDDNVLPAHGAGLTVIAGVGNSSPDYSAFIQSYFNPANASSVAENYLSSVKSATGLGKSAALAYLESLPPELQATYVLPAYYNELKMSGRDYNNPSAKDYKSYRRGFTAIAALFPGSDYKGNIDLSVESIGYNGPDNPNNEKLLSDYGGQVNYGELSTLRGGNINLLAPGGAVTVGQPTGAAGVNSGITTVRGGAINSYSAGSVEVNQSRLATLGGGNILVWAGDVNPAVVPNPPANEIANIDAGKGSKTELVAPAQSFLIDNATGVTTLDPAAVSTGNGIATLPAVAGAPPSDIDLIAPDGTVNASDAGIRVSGNFNVAAAHVVTNGNIAVAGTSVGVPTVAAPNIGGLTAASNAAGSSSSAADQIANQTASQAQQQAVPSLITVEVLGYGGG